MAAIAIPELPLDYKPCGCPGALAGRACRFCGSTKWMKRCKDCLGLGTLTKSPRQSNAAARVERCGRCSGAGWTPCPTREIPEAEAFFSNEAIPAPAPESMHERTEHRISQRRAQIKQSRKQPKRKVLGQTMITAERPNPVEAIELFKPEDVPAPAETTDPAEVSPASFAPTDLE